MQALNERQMDIVTAIREVAPPPDSEAWGDYTDVLRAVAKIVDGCKVLVNPRELQKSFEVAWRAAALIWLKENNRILRDCLGGQKDFDQVMAHPNGRMAFRRILERVQETHGELTVGMAVEEVEVRDILEELDIIG